MDKSITQLMSAEFLPLVRSVFGDRLVSVILYGSGADDSFRPGVSDVNILILLDEPQPALLERLAREGRRRMRKHRITVMVISEEEYLRGADVFPMEYMDIRDRHVLLFGKDITGELEFSEANLRQQLEQQLRGALFSLRQLIVAARGRKRVLKRELPRRQGTLQTIFKGLVRLTAATGDTASPHDESPLPLLAERFDFDPAPFEDLRRLRGGQKVETRELTRRLVLELAQLVRGVDRWNED
ncbi:MAG: hypothetical protein ACOC45_00430 [Alkalispirochaetaceae bacterium]